jgi:hypothetical protein
MPRQHKTNQLRKTDQQLTIQIGIEMLMPEIEITIPMTGIGILGTITIPETEITIPVIK